MDDALEDYDELECPHCGKICQPDAVRKNGTVVYERHDCRSEYEIHSHNRSFEINAGGELVEDE